MAKQKHSGLPAYIIADPKSKHFYINLKTKKYIHKSKLADHIPLSAASQKLKEERIQQARWDLNRD